MKELIIVFIVVLGIFTFGMYETAVQYGMEYVLITIAIVLIAPLVIMGVLRQSTYIT